MNKHYLIFLGSFFLGIVQTKEILFEGNYFSSERDLANHLYFEQDYKTLILLTSDSIEKERPCSFLEPFIEVSIRTAYEISDFQLLNFMYMSSKRCGDNNRVINEIYLKYLVEIEEYDQSYKILESLDRSTNYFPILQNKFFRDSGRWKYSSDFGTSLTRNSNINNGFTASEVDIYGMTFEVSDDSFPVDDLGVTYSYSGTFYKYFKKGTQLRLNAYLTGEDYSSSLADRYSPFLSADYILTKKDMISISSGRSYWNKKRVYELKSFSYTRLLNLSFIEMVRLSFGHSISPLSRENSSNFLSTKAFFNLKNNLYINFDYIENNTDFSFSTYSGFTLLAFKEFNLFSINIIPYIELEKRNYDGYWAAYDKKRSYERKNFGLVLNKNSLNNLKIKLSTNSFNSNIPIYDNRINVFELEYSFF